ncbi:MAG: ABC transporter ATP-binding protein [Clostridia bacterium]|nr:ABC transporter ATP-binding protein [Clostridia bacterium]MBQ6357503.1 ABC transporter ATP-binding protein [Clostridia bacterium]MBQ6866874.1 ABC transporter ATP-binding protein [Clostridia bacterium]
MIKLNDIVVKFGDFTALHDINVHVKEGEFFTFLGPSGCGKTTTLRTITGFIEPVSGSVFVKGRDITHVPIEDRNIGIVFQSYALFPTMTVYDNIAFGLKIKKFKKAEIDKKVREIAKKVDLSDEQLEKAVSQLSGGQQQRVAIARALVTNPAIICMDEPLSNLDAKLRVQLRNELKKMQKDFGITTIYVTHDQEEALTLSDRIAVFNKGYIEQIGTPNEVYNFSQTEFVCNFIGDINRLEDGVLQDLIAAGADVDPNKHNYIRLERLHVNQTPANGEVSLKGVVESREYYGLYIKYYITLDGQTIKVIEKNDGVNIYEPGQEVTVLLNPRDIMAYEAKEEA